MKADDGFIEFLHELLEPLGTITTRRMFGGHGVYCDGLFIAIVIEGRLYLKVDDESKAAFIAAGSAPFVFESSDKTIEMSYWSAPDDAMDSADGMRPWARMAVAAALRKPAMAKAAKAAKSAQAKAARAAKPKAAATRPAKQAPIKPRR